jgi:hypothetical protein
MHGTLARLITVLYGCTAVDEVTSFAPHRMQTLN